MAGKRSGKVVTLSRGAFAPAEIDNPDYEPIREESDSNPKRISAVVNLRESSVVTLAAHGVLDAAQVAAAFRFRTEWEVMQGARSANGMREWIDNGRKPPAVAERQVNAYMELERARSLLGAHGYMLVGRICGEGFSLRDIFAARRHRDTATDMLRIHLDSLAVMWQLSTRR